MELENKFAQISKTIFQRLRIEPDSSPSIFAFSSNYPVYFLERIYSYLVRKGLVVNYFDQSDFKGLNLDILREIGNSVDSDIELWSDIEIRTLWKSLTDELLANDSQYYSISTRGRIDFFRDYLSPQRDAIIEVIKPSPNQIIYEPDCYLGSLFINLNRKFPNHNLKFIGQESWISSLCKFNLFAHGLEKVSTIYSENPLHISTNQPKVKADIAVLTDGSDWLLSGNDEKFNLSAFERDGKIRTFAIAYIEMMLSLTKDDGKVIAVFPDYFLFNSENSLFRKKYLENDLVEKIISLPKSVVQRHTTLNFSIIILNKKKSADNKGYVIFDGKDNRLEKTLISNDEILSTNNYSLRAIRYALKEAKELQNIFAKTLTEKIRNLITSSSLGRKSSSNKILNNKIEVSLPFIRVSDLSKISDDFTLNISKIERKISLKKAKLIDYPAVLVNLLGTELKPIYFNFTGQPIAIGSDIVALEMKEGVNIEYFLTQLHSRLVQIQVEMISSGNIINRIRKEDFLDIKIPLPTLEEQQRQILEMRGLIEEKAKAREEVERAEKRTQQTTDELIASVAHSFKNKLSPVVMDYAILLDFLREANEKNEPIKFDTLVRPVFEGEKPEEVDTFGKVVNRLEAKLKTLPKVFNDFQILQKGSVNKSIVDLNEYFQEVRRIYTGANYKIKVINSSKNLLVELDKDAFGSVIDNLIANAKDHAFTEEKHNYQIVFELSETELKESKYARILYKYNGKGFPANFSYEAYRTFGSKSVYSGGDGIGGSIVNRMIELHNGEVSLFPPESPFDEFKSQIEILLPLYF